jgi:VWFA-related protein
MKERVQQIGAVIAGVALMLTGASPLPAQSSTTAVTGQVTGNAQSGYVLKENAELVLTNVVPRDAKTGEIIRDLKQSDFRVFEDGKEQKISSFDYQSVEMATPLSETTVSGLATSVTAGTKAVVVNKEEELRNHRLIVMFFDLTSMQPEDLDRAIESAQEYVRTKMQPADLVALVSLGDSLNVDQDFTADKDALIREVATYDDTLAAGFSSSDDSEYADINTDRQLYSLRAIAKSLEKVNEKKSLLYFSGGISRDGIENEASLRSTINQAVRSNLAIYSVDVRGLQAVLPLGDASSGSQSGQGAFTGASMQSNMSSNLASQEVMATLSSDTGGKSFFDSNDFAPAFVQVQNDTSAYYAIGFHSANQVRNGKYRRLSIKVERPGVKLDYRPGYYAPTDFKHSGKEDREQELADELDSELPATEMSVYLDAMYFRIDETHYYMPVSLVVPGSQIPFVKGGDKDKATLDIIGSVLDEVKRPIGHVRETVKLNVEQSLDAKQRNIQYTTNFKLPPGKYRLKFVVRENQTGRMGSFEAAVTLPDLKKSPLKMSSIILASMRQASKIQDSRQASKTQDPLTADGQQYVPNISHVFRQDQHMYLLYEVYNPGREKSEPGEAKSNINLITSLEILQGSTKVYESPKIQTTSVNVKDRDAVSMQLDVPLADLKPGTYICQLNVVDDAGGSFAFPRFAVLVKEPVAATVAPSTPTVPGAAGSGTGASF